MDESGDRILRKIVYVLDGILILLSAAAAYVIQPLLGDYLPFFKEPPDLPSYATMTVLVLALWLLLVPVFRLQMVFERIWSLKKITGQLLKHHFFGLVTLAVILFLTQAIINRSLVALFMICTFALMFAERVIFSARQRFAWQHGNLRPNILLVGSATESLHSFLARARNLPMPPRIIGRIAPDGEEGNPSDESSTPALIGHVGELEKHLHEAPADQVLFFPPFNTPSAAAHSLNICENLGVPARFAIDLSQPGLAAPRVVSVYDQPFITFEVSPAPAGPRAVKHGFDAVAAFLGLLVVFPVLVVVAIAVFISMGRPVFFVQERAGLYGRKFKMLKFRTMTRGAEAQRDDLLQANEMSGPVFKITDDPRVTRLGRFLRRSSIDELPQLIHVLRGTMSLVGPRPLPTKEQQDIYGWHRRRLSMKPGITGLWQVSGRNNIDFKDWMKLDLKYVDEWSLMLDTKILFKTFRAVISKAGAK